MLEDLIGDLCEQPDEVVDGWCWSPQRPEERLVVDLLVDDEVVSSMVAAMFRRDLVQRGYGDGRHGFAMRLPPNLPALRREALITARERRSGRIFGRLLRAGPRLAPDEDARIAHLERLADETRAGLAALRGGGDGAARSLRAASAALAGRLAGGKARLTTGRAPALPWLSRPRLTVAFRADSSAAACRCIDSLAAGMELVGAELLAVDPARDADVALLPACRRGLRLARAPGAGNVAAVNAALAVARGEALLWLAETAEPPSLAALLAFARHLAARPGALWLGGAAEATFDATLELPARLGLGLAVGRATADTVGGLDHCWGDHLPLACADLANKACLFGIPVHRVAEPAAAPGCPARADVPAPDSAMAAFRGRWGVPC